MKTLYIAALLLASTFASTAGSSGRPPPTSDPSANHGIISPDVATAFASFTRYNYNVNGDLVVCREANWGIGGECKLWTLVKDIPPSGRVYVGFRVHDYRLFIFWK